MKKLKKHIYFSTAANASFHAFISTGYLQTVDMRYNIRGQLTSMNNSKLSNDGGVTNGDNTDLFGMQFYYDQANSNLNTTPKYNGRMTGVTWMSTDAGGNKSYERAFSYYYDNINRDTAAIYSERPTASTTAFTITHGWDENRITYDGNGNIQTLFRMYASQGAGNHVPIDNLTYTYSTTSPNQLSTVTDATGNNAGFYNLTSSTTAYTYDANGNLTNDYYKGLGISYNFLNKTGTTTVTTGSSQYINYTYDGAGMLIRKQAYNNGTLQTTTDYIDGFVYVNSTLSYFPMPEGRVVNVSGILKQEFILTDQQGNARLAFQDAGNNTPIVTQENSYYAFGLIMPNSPVATPGNANKLLYNGGSEWQNDYGNLPDYYQTFNRNYDAALGRFVGVDPVAESAESMTSYNYAGNNPVMYNDPLGDKKCLCFSGGGGSVTSNYINFNSLNNPGPLGGGGGGSFGGSGDGGGGDSGGSGMTGYLNVLNAVAQAINGSNIESISITPQGLDNLYNAVENTYDENSNSYNGSLSVSGNGAVSVIQGPSSQSPSSPANVSAGDTGNSGSTTMYAMSGGMNYIDNANAGRPSFSSLQANYPGDNYTSAQVYKLVGGNIYQRYQDDPVAYANSCALRLSYALNKAGAPIPKLPGTAKGGDGMNYFFRVKDLGNYMNATYGAPDINGTSRSLYSGQQGIIEFNVSGWSDATGHFTIWDGNSVGHGDYFTPTPPAQLTNAHLWIFP